MDCPGRLWSLSFLYFVVESPGQRSNYFSVGIWYALTATALKNWNQRDGAPTWLLPGRKFEAKLEVSTTTYDGQTWILHSKF
jgi:hypothetical protein